MYRFVFASVTALVLTLPTAASAQEAGKVGITMGFPGSVGVLWHASENVALRPEFAFGFSSSEDEDSDIDGSSFSTGLSALFYLRRWDDLATYISPRYSFSRSTQSFDGPVFIEDEVTSRSHLVSGSFGAQYWMGDRFSAFGELGVAYSRNRPGDDSPRRAWSFGSRSSVGIVFYF